MYFERAFQKNGFNPIVITFTKGLNLLNVIVILAMDYALLSSSYVTDSSILTPEGGACV